MGTENKNCARAACIIGSIATVLIVGAVLLINRTLDKDSDEGASSLHTCTTDSGDISECSFCIDGYCECPPGFEGPGCAGNWFALYGATGVPTNETHWQSQGWSTCDEECRKDGSAAAWNERSLHCETVSYTYEGIIATAGI
jgi:hypothetical protein